MLIEKLKMRFLRFSITYLGSTGCVLDHLEGFTAAHNTVVENSDELGAVVFRVVLRIHADGIDLIKYFRLNSKAFDVD